ncbi:popeye domain-containing protein 3-like [Crassostrea angulata]|uniref:popeye domain-containing protein 3-like n=1 Tax=Magallana angulata TaxID=2784310 RepID=UPI0022B0E7C0|nr:popeye domain-containing protein 3-like [Crassostrea angulata]
MSTPSLVNTSLPVSLTPHMDPEVMNSTELLSTCQWIPPQHYLFQMANGVLLGAVACPGGKHGVLFMHSCFVLGFLLLSIWSWVILCAPDYFSWNFSFMVVNAVQTLVIMYNIRPVKFCDDLEGVYVTVFQPLRVPRHLYKKLVSPDYCTLGTLHEGEVYASQGISKIDRLGLLISGRMAVYSHHQELHHVVAKEFIDSPEFESAVSGDEKYQVSIVATTTCRFMFWQRGGLEYLLIKEPYLANLLRTVLGRDITNKLYSLNDKLARTKGFRVDIRLPSISAVGRGQQGFPSAVTCNQNLSREVGLAHAQSEETLEDSSTCADTERTELLNGVSGTSGPGAVLRSPVSPRSSVGC